MDIKIHLAKLKTTIADIENDAHLMGALGKVTFVEGLKTKIVTLTNALHSSNRSQGQYKSMYEKKSKECLRLKSEIERLERKLLTNK